MIDLCLVGPRYLGANVDQLVERFAAHGLSVADHSTLEDGEGAVGERTRALLDTLVNLNGDVVLLPGWRLDVVARVAAVNAAALNIPIYRLDPSLTDLGGYAFPSPNFDSVLHCVGEATKVSPAESNTQNAAPPVADNAEERPHEEAARIVLGARGDFYDHPFDNFTRTGLIWTGVLYSKLRDGEIVSPEDVALCMNGVKIAREAYRHKRDNLTDGHGYWMTHEMVVEERARRESHRS